MGQNPTSPQGYGWRWAVCFVVAPRAMPPHRLLQRRTNILTRLRTARPLDRSCSAVPEIVKADSRCSGLRLQASKSTLDRSQSFLRRFESFEKANCGSFACIAVAFEVQPLNRRRKTQSPYGLEEARRNGGEFRADGRTGGPERKTVRRQRGVCLARTISNDSDKGWEPAHLATESYHP